MSQDWNFDPHGTAVLPPPGPKPTPRRFRKLLRREEATLESLRPGAAPDEAAAPAESDGRDARGRFTKGNKGGTGNPFARQVAGFRKALVDAVTEQDFAELAGVLLAKAKGGDLAALKLLFAYTLGKPAEAPDPDRLDLEDFRLLRERLSPLQEDWHLIRKMVPVEGITEAGHRVADLRAASWREEVLGTAPAARTAEEVAYQAAEDAQLRQALAVVRAEPGQSAEWKAQTERLLIEAHEAGCLNDLLAALREETEKSLAALQGGNAGAPPSANGGAGTSAPSANGGNGLPAAAGNGCHGPSANGRHGTEHPRRRPDSSG